MRSRPREIGRK